MLEVLGVPRSMSVACCCTEMAAGVGTQDVLLSYEFAIREELVKTSSLGEEKLFLASKAGLQAPESGQTGLLAANALCFSALEEHRL